MSFQQFDQPRKRFENKTNNGSPYNLFDDEYRDGPPRDSQQYIRVKRRVEEIAERYRDLVSRQFHLSELLRDADNGDRMKLAMRETMKSANEERVRASRILKYLLKFQGESRINYAERERRQTDYNSLEIKIQNIDRSWAKAVAESKEAEEQYAKKCFYQQELIRNTRFEPESSERQESQLLLAEEQEDQLHPMLKERDREIAKLYDEMCAVADLNLTFNDAIKAPQVEIDSIMDNLNKAEEEIDRGAQEIVRTQELQDDSTKSMMCITISLVLCTLLMAMLMFFWLRRHGFL